MTHFLTLQISCLLPSQQHPNHNYVRIKPYLWVWVTSGLARQAPLIRWTTANRRTSNTQLEWNLFEIYNYTSHPISRNQLSKFNYPHSPHWKQRSSSWWTQASLWWTLIPWSSSSAARPGYTCTIIHAAHLFSEMIQSTILSPNNTYTYSVYKHTTHPNVHSTWLKHTQIHTLCKLY